MSITKTKTGTAESIIRVTAEVGDKLIDSFNKTEDLKTAQTALKAYGTAINAAKVQVGYKKSSGKPRSIKFLE